jgi:hypothetical protein
MDNKTRLSNDKHFSIIYLHFNSAAFQNVPIKPTVKQYNACYQFTIIAPALNFGHRGAIQIQPRYLVVWKELQSPLVITNFIPTNKEQSNTAMDSHRQRQGKQP